MKSKHYIGMAGIRGCLPSFCAFYKTPTQAARDLADMHECSRSQYRFLRKFGYLGLESDQGNEYAEWLECECNDPSIHSED